MWYETRERVETSDDHPLPPIDRHHLQDSMRESKDKHEPLRDSAKTSTDQETSSTISLLLSLPRELRDQCLHPLLLLTNPHPGSPPPLQPAISQVSHQFRYETLPTFYAINTFRFQLDFTTLLAKSRAWLHRIGDGNVKFLRRVELVGWRRIPFGHMFRRDKVLILVDLRTGGVEDREEGRLEVEDFKLLGECVRDGVESGWDVETLGAVMEAFWSGCADNY